MQADVKVTTFSVTCPKCSADVESPQGSLMWSVNETNPHRFECPNCKISLSLPAKALKWCS